MATQLDLADQEQLESIKHFWSRYGNLITWTLVLVLGAFAAWNGWNYWQRDQGQKAGSLYEALDQAALAGDADRAQRAFDDLRQRHGRTAYAAQGGLLAARVLSEASRADEAIAALQWVAADAGEVEFRALARLRLAGLLLDAQRHDEALKALSGELPPAFEALAADRRGDILQARGEPDQARAEYERAYKGLEAGSDYRRLVEAKLTALGAAPAAEVVQ